MINGTRAIKDIEMSAKGSTAQPPFGTFTPNKMQRFMIKIAQNSALKRGVFRSVLTRLIMGRRGKPLDVAFRDCHFRLLGHNNLIEYGILLNPDYNSADIEFLIEDAKSGDNFVDLGSNIGLYTLPLAKTAGDKGLVVSVDANPLMAQTLQWNAQASNLANIKMFGCAVSDKEGRGDLMVRKDDVAIVNVVEKEEGTVALRTLISIVAEAKLSTIHGLKIDIEGHEDKALVPFLDGAPKALLPKRICIEHPFANQDYPGCAQAFKHHGYSLVGRSRNNSFYRLA
jgi:FkbM family methyltransferase